MSSSTPSSSVKPGPKPSRKDIKQTLRGMSALCCWCRADQQAGFKRCANCGILYCSRECQKAHWPQHKLHCRISTGTNINIAKSSQILMANNSLNRYIEILLVLELDLLNNPTPLGEIFRTQVVTTFEPSKIQDFSSLFSGSATIDRSPMQGMFQLCAITSNKEDQWESFSTEEVKQFRREEAVNRKQPFRMGTIQWLRDGDETIDISNSVVIIDKEGLENARKIKYLDIPTQGGKTVKKPLSKDTCIEMINALIRQDTKNQWMLRANLHEKAKQWFKDAAAWDTDGPTVEFSPAWFFNCMKNKVAREVVFNHESGEIAEPLTVSDSGSSKRLQ